MKKTVLFTVLSMLLVVAFAQAQTSYSETDDTDTNKYLELLRSDIRAERVAIVTEAMNFSDEESKVFWPLYREYEAAMTAIGDKEVALIEDYANNFTSMTDEKAEELMGNALKYDEERIKLQRKYFKKFSKILPATKAAKFFQVDRRIDQLIDLQIAAALPVLN
jgi:hypothetical protein